MGFMDSTVALTDAHWVALVWVSKCGWNLDMPAPTAGELSDLCKAGLIKRHANVPGWWTVTDAGRAELVWS